jgi:hypothetical protein
MLEWHSAALRYRGKDIPLEGLNCTLHVSYVALSLNIVSSHATPSNMHLVVQSLQLGTPIAIIPES